MLKSINFKDVLSRAARTAPPALDGPAVIPLPETIDKLRSRFEAERARVIHEQGELDKLDLEFDQLRTEYEGIKAEIAGRKMAHEVRMRDIQTQIIEALKACNIKGEIVPMGGGSAPPNATR